MATRRTLVRIFFLVTVLVMAVDIIPSNGLWWNKAKSYVSFFLNRAGLWQGQWTMFAPNPVINKAILTAEIESRPGEQSTWDSIDWKVASRWEKFYRFRHLNFYNRIWLDSSRPAAKDFSDFIARQSTLQPVRKVRLSRISTKLLIEEPGAMPIGEDAIWISSISLVVERKYPPP